MLTLREMSQDELPRAVEIDISERGELVYKYIDGKLEATPEGWYRPTWNAETLREGSWTTVLKLEGVKILGTFDGDRLVGIAVLRPRLTPTMAQLAALFVSKDYRRQGVARALTEEVCRLAREQGHSELYVSATPSESAVGFYLSQGFKPTTEVNPELFALEPEDIHMIKAL